MTIIERSTVVGVFEDRVLAEQALDDLHRAGFKDHDIGFVVRNLTTNEVDSETIQRETAAGAATGAVSGGVVGGLLGAAAALLIPGLGPALAGGILAVTLGGAALGAVAGSFAGALTGFGIPEEEAVYYQNELEMGRTIVTVNAPERYQEALDILRRFGAYDAGTRNAVQNIPLYASETVVTDAYDPDATVKSPALASSQNYSSETASETSEVQPTANQSASRQYERPAETDASEDGKYNANIPAETNY
jgi:hypothetical protein